MFGLSHHQRFFLLSQTVDMRRAFDGLSGIVQQQMGRNVTSGDVYIYLGKRLDRMNRTAAAAFGVETKWFYLVLYKIRGWWPAPGTFRLPKAQDQSISLTYSELSLLLEGLDVEVKYRRKRYSKILEKVH